MPGKRCAQSLGSPGSEGSRAPCGMAWRVRLGGPARWSRSYCLVTSGQRFKNCQEHRALWPPTCPVTLLLGGDRPRCSGHGAAGPTERPPLPRPPPSLRWGRGYSHSSHISRDNAVISGRSHASKLLGATARRARAATPAGARGVRTERRAEDHRSKRCSVWRADAGASATAVPSFTQLQLPRRLHRRRRSPREA